MDWWRHDDVTRQIFITFLAFQWYSNIMSSLWYLHWSPWSRAHAQWSLGMYNCSCTPIFPLCLGSTKWLTVYICDISTTIRNWRLIMIVDDSIWNSFPDGIVNAFRSAGTCGVGSMKIINFESYHTQILCLPNLYKKC